MDTNQEAIRTVIVDDEPLARESLRLRLQDVPDVDIVGEASQMPDMNGFDVLDEVASSSPGASTRSTTG